MSGVGQAVFMNQRSFNTPPVNTILPVITGTAEVGQTLSVSDGTWTGTPTPTFTYQWQRVTTNISAATASTYVVEDADVGSTIRCVVTATNAAGSADATTANTAVVVKLLQLFTWGDNTHGQLGRNNTYSSSSPQQVGALTNWSSIAVGQGSQRSMAAVLDDGKLFTWGENRDGGLGHNDRISRSSPTQVGALTNWKMVAQGLHNCHAVKTDGTMWGWGYSNNTELGQGANNPQRRSSPVQIGTFETWEFVARARRAGMAKTTGGQWYVWGYNQVGTLGLGNAGAGTNRFVPTFLSAGAGLSWAIISGGANHMNAIKTDGTLWSWGNNTRGQIGNGTSGFAILSTPLQIGALTNWLSLSSFLLGCLAVKTDGTLWSWGYNNHGQLGIGNRLSRSSPVQVGALTNWTAKINAGAQTCMAIKDDGTMWAWGRNNIGQLGLGNTIYRSSPVQVGALTTWDQIGFLNNYSSAALKKP